MESQYIVILVGWWLPHLPELFGGPRVGTYCMLDINDSAWLERALVLVQKYLDLWPVGEYQFISKEELNKTTIEEMRKRVVKSYQEWYTPEKLRAYAEAKGYELHEGLVRENSGDLPRYSGQSTGLAGEERDPISYSGWTGGESDFDPDR